MQCLDSGFYGVFEQEQCGFFLGFCHFSLSSQYMNFGEFVTVSTAIPSLCALKYGARFWDSR